MIDLTTCTHHQFTPPGAGLATLTVQCAWCMKSAGIPLGNGSHGICSEHAAQVIEAYRARKREKNAKQG